MSIQPVVDPTFLPTLVFVLKIPRHRHVFEQLTPPIGSHGTATQDRLSTEFIASLRDSLERSRTRPE